QPGLLEEASGDVPQGVTLLDHVGIRVVASNLGGQRIRGNGQQRYGQCRADRFQHGGVPDSPCRCARASLTDGGRRHYSPDEPRHCKGRGGDNGVTIAPLLVVVTHAPIFAAMSLLPILEFPDPRLRTVAAPVDPAGISSPEFRRLLDDMFETM